MERPAIREEYMDCLNAFRLREGLAIAGANGHSRLILEFGLEPEVAKAITSFWLSTLDRECALSGTCQ
jgi:hypothetical protein